MTIASISFRQKLPPVISAAIIRSHRYIFTSSVVARQQQNPNNVRKPQQQQQQQPQRSLLKARETLKKQFSSLAPVLSPNDTAPLSENQAIGTVASAQANFMRVVVDSLPLEWSRNEDSASSGVELLCYVKAVLKKIKRRVLVGDQVLVGSIDWVDKRGMIENVFERKSEIFDPPVANVDHFLVLFSLDQPKIEPFMLTRFLVEAESTRLPLTIALNKVELVDEEILSEWKTRLRSWGYEPVLCSVDTKQGLDTLQFILRDQMSVIVGPSGVGKSSLINSLRGGRGGFRAVEDDSWFEPILGSKWFEEQRVGEVSTRSGRGKHTTRNVSLLLLSGGGYLADTPGFNQPSLMKVTAQSLALHFPEIQKMLADNGPGKCSFSNCLHIGEPGCLVKGDWERYPYYLQLLDEIKIREEFQLRTVGTKREGGRLGVLSNGEPRLEPKKHRRQSRKTLNQSLLVELDELDDEDDATPMLGIPNLIVKQPAQIFALNFDSGFIGRRQARTMKKTIWSGFRSLNTVAGSFPRLTKFSLHAPKSVKVEYNNGSAYILSAEYLRIYSPAVDSKIRTIGVEKVISGRRHVGIMSAEPVGNYGVRLLFDDLHRTGIYTWEYFYQLGSCKFSLMRNYIGTLKRHGLSRDPQRKK
ncbi:hypothetical protein F511_03155 [Dorcoceras hygrometricum]|nr:hypothetical protein F511_03155 [Dorcoceras hygrometricum]